MLDRDNGKPLEKAMVQLWTNSYSYTTRKYETAKSGLYTTDKNGFVKITKTVNYENSIVQVKYNNDELFTDDGYNSYYFDDINAK